MGLIGHTLPDFPWDTLDPARDRAASYPGGVVDLTIGSPVDPVPPLAIDALREAEDAHAYPPNTGSAALRDAIRGWFARRRKATSDFDVLPTIGSKEMVALLPSFLGLGSEHSVGFPIAAYPTYDVGARLAGATPVAIDTDGDPQSWPRVDLLWLNSPGNPTGHVHSREHLTRVVAWARSHDVIVASDECYAELCWDVAEAPSILDDAVCGSDSRGLLSLYSLSKQSNLAGYRAAFIAGDPALMETLREIRKHAGFMVPGPVQHVMTVLLGDDEHVATQRAIYGSRRTKLLAAIESAGMVNDPESVGGLYLWATREGSDAWELVDAFAQLGIVVAPGTFYGDSRHVRISLTASDEAIDEAARRIPKLSRLLDAPASDK